MSELALQLIAENKKTKAKTLDLGNCGMTEVPEEVGECVWLEELILSDRWSEFDFEEKRWRDKTSQNLGKSNKIKKLPPALPKLQLLKKVVFIETKISDLTPLANLTNLQLLYCGDTRVSNLGPLVNLINLQLLSCRETQVSDLTPLANLTNLQLLSCYSTQVSDLAPLANLTNLQRLTCGSIQVSDLTPLANLGNLQILSCSNSKVSDLRPIQRINNLQQLECRGTLVSDLTTIDWIQFPKLERLDISFSKVENLLPLKPLIQKGLVVEWSIAKNGICVKDCPLTNPPVEIAQQGNEAILNYFREKERQGTVKLREAKLLLVGEGGAGKTSLLRRLYQKQKPLPEENESTKGIEIHRHDFKMPDGSDFRLNVWDFGGQEIYHATHQFFLTKRSLYVLLDDTRSNHKTVHDAGFKYWLEVVDLLSDHSPVLIFQNEKSGRSKNIDAEGIKAKFANVRDLWRGNLEQPDAADKLSEAIEFFARNLPHIGEELPAKWVDIRAEMEELAQQKPHISQKEYFDLYGRHLEFDRQKALHLSRYFHDLGVFLHFQDDDLLGRTVILQNTWATEAVFKMLDDEQVKGRFGRFGKADCARVWRASEYADMHPELLALMEKFELCYRLPDTDTWLAPQLLPPSKPESLKNWEQAGDLVLRFKYEFLPKGLVSRLMVRQHRFVRQAERGWVSGVFFEHDHAELLAEIPPQGNEITLRARGAERKELLSVIAADLDALNATFHGLPERVGKWVPCICSHCRALALPEFFEQKRLVERKDFGVYDIECPRPPFEKVSVIELLDGIRIKRLPAWAKKEQPRRRADTRTLKIFIASSMTLEERKAVPELALQLNKMLDGLRIEPVLCDFDAPAGDYGGGRFQDHFNRLLDGCDVALVLFYNKAGAFTIEEMLRARRVCSKTFVYFKTGFVAKDRAETAALDKVFEVKDQLAEGKDLVYREFSSVAEFRDFFKNDVLLYWKEVQGK